MKPPCYTLCNCQEPYEHCYGNRSGDDYECLKCPEWIGNVLAKIEEVQDK